MRWWHKTLLTGLALLLLLTAGAYWYLQKQLAALPVQTGLAFVVVQHLAPDQPSILPELLQRSTAVPVLNRLLA